MLSLFILMFFFGVNNDQEEWDTFQWLEFTSLPTMSNLFSNMSPEGSFHLFHRYILCIDEDFVKNRNEPSFDFSGFLSMLVVPLNFAP